MTSPPTLVIFGAEGQIGSALTSLPCPDGWRLLPLNRTACDITDSAQVAMALAPIRHGVAINLAAFTQVDRAEDRRDQAFAVNCDGAARVAHAAARQGIPLIHLSTDYVFPGVSPHPLTETSPTAPQNIYGASKLAGETAVLETHSQALILRTSWVFGEHGHNFVKSILHRARIQPEVGVVTDQTGCPTPASQIAVALWHLATRIFRQGEPADYGIFHFCGTPPTSWYNLAEAVLCQAATHGPRLGRIYPIGSTDLSLPARRPAYSALDCGKLRRQHGISQPLWRQSLPALVAHLLASP